jgi:hypothetical protein
MSISKEIAFEQLIAVPDLSDTKYGEACRLINDGDTGLLIVLSTRPTKPAIEAYLDRPTRPTGPSDAPEVAQQGATEVFVLMRRADSKQSVVTLLLVIVLSRGIC